MGTAWDNLRARAQIGQSLQPMAVQQPANFQPFIKPQSRHEQLMQLANSDVGEYTQYAEIIRVCELPVDLGFLGLDDPAFIEYNKSHLLAQAFAEGFRFFVDQANAIRAFEECEGLFAPMGVGWGKTLTCYALATVCHNRGMKKGIYFTPSHVYEQTSETDLKWARSKIPIPYAVHRTGGKGISLRRNLAQSDRPGLYIMPYSQLSTADAEELLYTIDPDFLLLDEAHNVRNRHAARTRRLLRFMQERQPKVAALSGTITNKSLNDYHHLISCALGEKSPLPLSNSLVAEWSAVIDSKADEEGAATGPILPLITWASRQFPQEHVPGNRIGFRKAFKLRMRSAPGVVATGDADIGVSLHFNNDPVKNYEKAKNWDVLQFYMDKVVDEWTTPNGDPIDHAIHTWKWLYELSAGFFNQLSWPTAEEYARRTKKSESESEDVLERAREHHSALQDYHKVLRSWLQNNHIQGVDTPFLVGQDMMRNTDKNVGSEVYQAWAYAKGLDFEGRPDRDSEAIRVCDFKVNHACIWAHEQVPKGEGALIWVHHQAMGRWVYEWLMHYGFDVLYCPAGPQHNEAILNPDNAKKIIVASITAHGEGKNLQHFRHQHVVQWPRSATKSEQMLGRTHRNGQKADELVVSTNNTLDWDDMNFGACLNDALYIHQSTGNRQKMIVGGYHPLPMVFPWHFLHERGLEVQQLSAEQQAILHDKFGARK